MAYHPNRASVSIAVYLGKKHNFTLIVLELLANLFDVFFNPKNISETNDISNNPLSIGQLEKRTSSRATDAI